MSKTVARAAVASIWIVSFLLAFLDFPINMILFSFFTVPIGEGEDAKPMMPVDSRAALHSLAETTRAYLDSKGSTTTSMAIIAGAMNKLGFADAANLTGAGEFLIGAAMDPDSFEAILDSIMIEHLMQQDTNNNTGGNAFSKILNIIHPSETQTLDWCSFFSTNKMWLEICVMILTLLCFVFLIICYGIIFTKVSHQTIAASHRSTKKLMVTTIILLGAYTIW